MSIRLPCALFLFASLPFFGACEATGSLPPTPVEPDAEPTTIRVYTAEDRDALQVHEVGTYCLFSGWHHKIPGDWVVCRGQVEEFDFGQLRGSWRLPNVETLWLHCSRPLNGPKPGTKYTSLTFELGCSWGWDPHPLFVIRRVR